jgi:hypothetical protein
MEGEKRGLIETTRAEVLPVAQHYSGHSAEQDGRSQILFFTAEKKKGVSKCAKRLRTLVELPKLKETGAEVVVMDIPSSGRFHILEFKRTKSREDQITRAQLKAHLSAFEHGGDQPEGSLLTWGKMYYRLGWEAQEDMATAREKVIADAKKEKEKTKAQTGEVEAKE